MKIKGLALAASAAAMVLSGAVTANAGALYDMNMFLNQDHPFDASQNNSNSQAQPVPSAAATGQTSTPTVVNAPAPEMAQATGTSRFGERSDDNDGWGAISEIRVGVLEHDFGPFSSNKESDSPDFNAEVLFVSPDVLDVIWSPRPHIGTDINSGDDTSQIYAGLSWEWFLWGDMFAGFSLGGAVHDGETTLGAQDPKQTTKKELGCRLLFRESVEVGWMVTENHSLSLMLDHISNAKLCDENEGLENLGIRYGYRF